MTVRPYRVGYSFAGYETLNPSLPKPAAALDGEFANLAIALKELRDYVGFGLAPGSRVIAAEGLFPDAVVTADTIIFVTPPLTAVRDLILPLQTATPWAIDIVRAVTSTGAFDLRVLDSVGGLLTTVAADAAGRYARLSWSGAAWTISSATGDFPLAQEFNLKGAYAAGTQYIPNDKVSFTGASYVAIKTTVGNQPDTNPAIWQLIAAKGDTGATGAAGSNGTSFGNGAIAVVDFGAFPGSDTASIAVADATIGAGSAVLTAVQVAASADHSADEHLVEEMDVLAGPSVAGVGFTLYARTRNTRLYGLWNLAWQRR